MNDFDWRVNKDTHVKIKYKDLRAGDQKLQFKSGKEDYLKILSVRESSTMPNFMSYSTSDSFCVIVHEELDVWIKARER
jgi:dsDNA-binding SOS-regulon protein